MNEARLRETLKRFESESETQLAEFEREKPSLVSSLNSFST